jgi:hypothetical protein
MVDIVKVLVCGSRAWTNTAALTQRMQSFPPDTLIIHGDAKGVDRLADRFARVIGLPVLRMPADWQNEGKAAGIRRNLRMLDEQPDLVLAFWDGQSRGTAHTITEAEKRGIPVEVIST